MAGMPCIGINAVTACSYVLLKLNVSQASHVQGEVGTPHAMYGDACDVELRTPGWDAGTQVSWAILTLNKGRQIQQAAVCCLRQCAVQRHRRQRHHLAMCEPWGPLQCLKDNAVLLVAQLGWVRHLRARASCQQQTLVTLLAR